MPPKQPKTPQKAASLAPAAQPTQVEAVSTKDELAQSDVAGDAVKAVDPITGRKLAYPLPTHISPTTINNAQSFLRLVILGLITGAAVGSRLFAVIRFESVIHELQVAFLPREIIPADNQRSMVQLVRIKAVTAVSS